MKQTNPRDNESFDKENICSINHEAIDELSDCRESGAHSSNKETDKQFDREETNNQITTEDEEMDDRISNEDNEENDESMDDWIPSEDYEENDGPIPSEDYEDNDDWIPSEDYEENDDPISEDYEENDDPISEDYEENDDPISEDYEENDDPISEDYEENDDPVSEDYEENDDPVSEDYKENDDPIPSEDYEENDDPIPSEEYEKSDDWIPREDYEENDDPIPSENHEENDDPIPSEDYEKIVDEESNFRECNAQSIHQENDKQSFKKDGPSDHNQEVDNEENGEQSNYQGDKTDLVPNQQSSEDDVQILSIHWLDVQSVRNQVKNKFSPGAEISLSEAIKAIIDIHNKLQNNKKEEGSKGGSKVQETIKRRINNKQQRNRKTKHLEKKDIKEGSKANQVPKRRIRNELRENKKIKYLRETKGTVGGYLFQSYSRVNEIVSKLTIYTQKNKDNPRNSQDNQENNKNNINNQENDKDNQEYPKSKSIHYIYFFYQKEPYERIFALTSGDAWRVVRRYASPLFPVRVLEKVGNPKVPHKFGRRHLFGKNTLEEFAKVDEYMLRKTANLYYMVEYLSCELKDNSSLSRLIKENGRRIMIRTGGVLKIMKRFAIPDYPRIFNKLAEYMDGTPTYKEGIEEKADQGFEFLHFLQPVHSAKKQHLDNSLMKSIYRGWKKREELDLQISHVLLKDFLCAASYKILIGSSKFTQIKPPTLREIVKRCGVNTSDENTFISKMQRTKLSFTDQSSVKQNAKPIIDCIEGRLHDSGNTFFKMRGKWYEHDTDFPAILNEDFKDMFEKSLIKENTEGWLHLPWSYQGSEDSEVSAQKRRNIEAMYNRSYLVEEEREKGFLVFDQITSDNIEPCDILKYCKDSNTLYLYQVKEKLSNHTRVACAQILNAAEEIQDARANNRSPDFLEKLWNKVIGFSDNVMEWRKVVKGHLLKLGKTEFMNMFQNANTKIVFVYAYVPLKNKSFSNLSEKGGKPIGEKLTKKLIDAGYLDSHHRLTGKFLSASEETFELDVKVDALRKRIYHQLAARRFSQSTAAKMELVHLDRNLRDQGVGFRICEIPRGMGVLNNKTEEKVLAFELPGPSSERKSEPGNNRKRPRKRSAKKDSDDKRQKRMTDFFLKVKPEDEEGN